MAHVGPHSLEQVKVALRNRSRQASSLDVDTAQGSTDSRLPMQASSLQGYDEMHSVGGKKVEFALL